MTARFAQYTGALKNFESPDYAHGYFSRSLSCAFVPIDTNNVLQNLKFVALPVPEIIAITVLG